MISLLELLIEANNAPKAIFMAGPAGSGKTTIRKKLNIEGFQIINIDDEYEELLKQSGIESDFAKMTPDELSKSGELMGQARRITKDKESQSIEGLNNIIIDGTGAASKPILAKKKLLEDLGYTTFMILIYVSPVTSLERNVSRDRKLPTSAVLGSWRGVVSNIEEYKKAFGNNIVLLNTDDKTANKDFPSREELLKRFPMPKGKPKTPEEMEKRRKKAEQVNNEIKQLLQIDREFEGFDEAKNKIVKFLNY